MKILLFNFTELGGLGGVDVMVVTLARQFNQAGHPAGILEIAKGHRPERELPDGTRVWAVTVPSRLKVRRPRSWASFVRATVQFMSVVHKFEPDIINVHFPHSQCLPVVGAHSLPHKWRLVVTLHNSDIRVTPLKDPGMGKWQARLFERADAVTAVNQALLDDAISLFPMIAGKGKVILNGVGPQWFQPLENGNNGRDYVLFSGRLNHVKGADLLLKAWSNVHQRFPLTDLWLAGDGDEQVNLEKLAQDLSIGGSVRFMGRKDQQELRQLYQHARAVVLPSRREGLPLALLEAGAAGAICVGSRTPGIPEIIQDGITGYLFDCESVEGLSAGIGRVLDLSPNARWQMRQAAQNATRQRFSEEGMIANYLDLFRSLL